MTRSASHPDVIREWTGRVRLPRSPRAGLPKPLTRWQRVLRWLNTPIT